MLRAFIRLFTLFTLLTLAVCSRATTYYIAPTGSDTTHDGLSPTSPFATIQHGIDTAVNGDAIQVATGTYYEHINWFNANLTLTGAGAGQSFIDARHNGTCITLVGLPSTAGLSGFTLQNGYGAPFGGGIDCQNGSPTITNCTFTSNSASTSGGGVYSSGGSPTITNCTFSNNSADLGVGGGMYCGGGSPTITDCDFNGNNTGGEGGAGIFNEDGNLVITNCIFTNNTAFSGYGGGIFNVSGSLTITNCTCANNTVTDGGSGGGIFCFFGSGMITNSIFWGDNGGEISGSLTVIDSDVQGGIAGTGNINIDPLFVDGPHEDMHLTFGSPAIDAGSDTAIPTGITTDLAGNPRISYAHVDMGAYEYQLPIEVTARVRIQASGFTAAGSTNYTQTLTITNTGASAIAGPIYLLLDNLGGTGVQLTNRSGIVAYLTPTGQPYISLSNSIPAQGSLKILLKFSNPNRVSITDTPRLFAGPGSM